MTNERGHEFTGRSVDEATATGLKALGLRSNQVTVEVINKGSRGLFGIGSEPAVVRLIPIIGSSIAPATSASLLHTETAAAPVSTTQASEVVDAVESDVSSNADFPAAQVSTDASTPDDLDDDQTPSHDDLADDEEEGSGYSPEEEAETEAVALELLSKLVRLLGMDATIEPVWKDEDDEHDGRVLWLNIRGRNLSNLIGRRGETLDSMQYLMRMMVNQRLRRWNDIVIDVDQYRQRRSEQLTQLAQRMATQVLSSGRAMSLEPMPPNERRIVHMALRDHTKVYTQSSGEGERRKVFIVPKN